MPSPIWSGNGLSSPRTLPMGCISLPSDYGRFGDMGWPIMIWTMSKSKSLSINNLREVVANTRSDEVVLTTSRRLKPV